MNKQRLGSFCFQLLASVPFLFMPLECTWAHSPHHVITDIATAPAGSGREDVFILITDQLFRSDGTGAAWKNLVNGMNNEYVLTSVVVSPNYASDHSVFVSTAGDGIYRSRDNGSSWRLINAGLDRHDISRMSLAVDDAGSYKVLAASARGGVWQLGSDDRWQRVLTETVQVEVLAANSASGQQSDVYAGDTSGRLWISADRGRLWGIAYEFPSGQSITSIAALGENVFVGVQDEGLYRSENGGATFEKVDSFRPGRRNDCHGGELANPVADSHITSITLSPEAAETQRVFVTTWYDAVFVSDDAGLTWSQWDDGLTCDVQADQMSQAHFRRLAVDTSGNGEPIYWLGAFDGLFRGEGASPSWTQPETLPLGLIKGMAVTSGSDDLSIALATYGGGFYLTEDRGSSWTIGNKGLQTTRLTGLAFSPDYAEDGVIYAGASRRLLRSSDRGQSWQRIDLRIRGFGRRVRNKLRRWGIPTGWLGSDNLAQVYPTKLVMSADDADKVRFATRSHGVMGYEHSTGDLVSLWSETRENVNTLEMSPNFSSDHTLFASIRGEGVIRSTDSGNHWVAANDGLDFVARWKSDPGGGNLRRDVFIAISPNFADDGLVLAGSPTADGLFVSRDRGDVWTRLPGNFGGRPAPVLAIAFSPDYAVDKTLMVSVRGLGVFRSSNGGQTFLAVGSELTAENASIELMAISPRFSADHSVVAASDEQLFISEDSGTSWAAIPRPVRYEDMRDVVSFSGDVRQRVSENYSAMTETLITGAGSSANMRFVGNGIRLLGSRGGQCGSANVYLDGALAGPVNCVAEGAEAMQTLFQVDGLTFGAHAVVVRIESDASGESVGIDAFDVLSTDSPDL